MKGPAAATVAVLLDCGWGPHRPDHWTSSNGTNFRVGASPASAAIIGMAFKDCIIDLAWSKAAGHFMGSGLEEGAPDHIFEYLDGGAAESGVQALRETGGPGGGLEESG